MSWGSEGVDRSLVSRVSSDGKVHSWRPQQGLGHPFLGMDMTPSQKSRGLGILAPRSQHQNHTLWMGQI